MQALYTLSTRWAASYGSLLWPNLVSVIFSAGCGVKQILIFSPLMILAFFFEISFFLNSFLTSKNLHSCKIWLKKNHKERISLKKGFQVYMWQCGYSAQFVLFPKLGVVKCFMKSSETLWSRLSLIFFSLLKSFARMWKMISENPVSPRDGFDSLWADALLLPLSLSLLRPEQAAPPFNSARLKSPLASCCRPSWRRWSIWSARWPMTRQ